jgi:hypothetical protein
MLTSIKSGQSHEAGQKSYWGPFHEDVTLTGTSWLNPAKSGVGGELHQMISGSEQ